MKHFSRPVLADYLCEGLNGGNVIGPNPVGILVGPPKIGKSTFLRRDLMQAAVSRGWVTVYVDLASQPRTSPGVLMRSALLKELEQCSSRPQQEGDTGRLGTGKDPDAEHPNICPPLDANSSLQDLIRSTVWRASAPLLLIIDEAQQACVSKEGMACMAGLKACRDELNQSKRWQAHAQATFPLMCLMVGSNTDKLASLCISQSSLFYRSELRSFAFLENSFIQFFADEVRENTKGAVVLDIPGTQRIFDLLCRRPDLLESVIGRAVLNGQLETLESDLSGVSPYLRDLDGAIEAKFQTLTPLQQAVFEVIATHADATPYSQASLETYSAVYGKPVSAATVQAAIDGLRKAELVWKRGKADYCIEDNAYRAWFARRQQLRAV